MTQGQRPYSGHPESLGILLRGPQERAGFAGRAASVSFLLYCAEKSFATAQHLHKATGLIQQARNYRCMRRKERQGHDPALL